MKEWLIILITLLVSVAIYRDVYNLKRKRTLVVSNEWICSKGNPKPILRPITWNDTLYNLPNLMITPYIGHKPVESFFYWSDVVKIPYSKEATILFDDKWPANVNDSMCVYVDPYPTHCNIFEMCIWWPFTLVLKPFVHYIDPYREIKTFYSS